MKKSANRFLLMAVLFLWSAFVFGQSKKTVTGIVIDAEGKGIPSVSINEKGKQSGGVISDENGQFSITVGANARLVFSSVGFVSEEVKVGNETNLTIYLTASQNSLSEVVVTGFGDRKRSQIGSAVTTVTGDEIRKTGAINPISALQGMVPGMQVQPGIGGPQSTPRFQIRGSASLDPYGNQPLIVVDNIIMDQDVAIPNRGGDQDFGNILKDINPDDIESVTILRGGAVTALYGSRAANGVILIKTKKGFSQKGLGISVTHNTHWDDPWRTVAFQNQFGSGQHTGDFITSTDGQLQINPSTYGYNFGPPMDGQTVLDVTGKIIQNNPRPDNVLSVFRTAVTNNTNVGVSGGNENGTFRLSYSKNASEGISPNNSFDRHSVNFRATQRLLGRVMIDASVAYTKSKTVNPANLGGGGIFRNFVYGGTRNYDTDYWINNYIDSEKGGLNDEDPSGLTSIWYALFENRVTSKDDNIRGSVDVRAPLYRGLEFQGNVSMNYIGTNYESRSRGTDDGFANPGYNTSINNVRTGRYRGNLNYTKRISDFDIMLQGGGEFNTSIGKYQSAWTNGGILPDIYRISNTKNPAGTNEGTPNERQTGSLFYQASIDYRGFLTMNVYGRNDWNSTLVYNDGHGNYSYFYPGVDLAWVITNSFKEKLPSFIDYGKLMVSYVSAGNGTGVYTANTGAYQANGPYTNNGGASVINYQYQSNTLPNQNLLPERNNKFELGLEFKMFQNRLGSNITYYTQDSKNQIISFGVPSTSGVGAALINGGLVRNRGLEITLFGTPVKSSNFSWDTYFIYTRNRNTVISLPFGLQYVGIGGGDGFQVIAKAGGEYGTIIAPYGYAKYQATDGDGKAIESPLNGKRVIRAASSSTSLYVRATNYVQGLEKAPVVGSILPDFLGSWRNTFNYKNLQFTVGLDSKFGGKIFSVTSDMGQWLGSLESTLPGRTTELGGISYTNAAGDARTDGHIFDGVYQQGSTVVGLDGATHDISGMTHQQAYDAGIVRPTSTLSYYANGHSWANGIREDAIFTSSWVSVQQATLTYDLPPNIANKFKMNGLRVGLYGNDLFFLYNNAKDKVNPYNLNDSGSGAITEGSGMPYVRRLGFTIQGSF